MVDTCVSTLYDGGNIPLYTDNIIMMSGFIVVSIFLRIFVYHLENVEIAPSPLTKDSHVSYGLGAKNAVKTMAMTLIALCSPIIAIFYVFRAMPGDSGKEFACQAQFGIQFVQIGIFSSVILIVATNYLRLYTRHTFANRVADLLKPVNIGKTGETLETAVEEVGRIVVLPAYRGVWVSPFCNMFANNCKAIGLKHESYTFDCFESVYNNETDNWLRHNMKIEKVENLTMEYTNFERLNMDDQSVDVFVLPLGCLTTFLSGIPGKEISIKEKDLLTKNFFCEVMRILKPGGHFIASHMLAMEHNWDILVPQSGFSNYRALGKVWYSFLPATVFVCEKPSDFSGDLSLSASGVSESSAVLNAILTVTETTTTVTKCESIDHSVTKESVSVRSTFEMGGAGNEEKEMKVLRTTVVDRKIQNHDLFPPGWNWRFVEFLITLTFVMYVAFVVLVWQILEYVQVPYRMPFDNMISGLFVSNACYVPVALYSMIGDLRRVAAICTIPTRLHIISFKSIMKVYRKHMMNLLIVVSIVTIVLWLPYVALDMTLFALFDISAEQAEQVNLIIGIAVVMILIPIMKRLYKYVVVREELEKMELEQVAVEIEADLEEDHIRNSQTSM